MGIKPTMRHQRRGVWVGLDAWLCSIDPATWGMEIENIRIFVVLFAVMFFVLSNTISVDVLQDDRSQMPADANWDAVLILSLLICLHPRVLLPARNP